MIFRYEESRVDQENREYIAESTESCVYGRSPGRIPVGDILAKFVEFLKGSGYNIESIVVNENHGNNSSLIENK